MPAYRLLQYTSNISNSTVLGSTRVSIDSQIQKLGSKPDSKKAVFIPLKDADVETVASYINASSPIIFQVDDKVSDTNELEDFLLSGMQKAPIYFIFGKNEIPSEFSYVKTVDIKANNPIKKTKMQNVIGIINSSRTYGQEKIAIITAALDSFSTAPSAPIGANSNGISLAALLEIMRQVSKFPITNNWVFIFALTDGNYCGYEGLEKYLSALSAVHSSKIKFAVSLESISSPKLRGVFGQRLRRDSAFANFMYSLLDALKTVGIQFDSGLNDEEHFSQLSFNKHLINSIAILNQDGDRISRVTDTVPNVTRANDIAWAVSEGLLRMMYNADNTATMIDRDSVDTSKWADIIANVPRMSAFRDQTFSQVILQWMKKFTPSATIDEWTSNKCIAPYTAASATLVFYNRVSFKKLAMLFIVGVAYGVAALLLTGRKKVFELLSHK
ncbi:hypothetical protein GPJ56_010333 [Histomonas meleagridis]|uniref:uncharacterized protein n=1 Tax=Histomonas meleagridis TaxID=135588 RepID=UPI003559F606|nr:hypothetical protein GPJ56_010333 [Histomonas meleagridis]KAH0797940.1 hypothetical protein GO595_009569 [Histomonas meleagridis]